MDRILMVRLLQESLDNFDAGDDNWKNTKSDVGLTFLEKAEGQMIQLMKCLDDTMAQLQCKKAEILIKLKRNYRALNVTNKVLSVDSHNVTARRLKSEALLGLNQMDLAAEELRRILLSDPDNQHVKEQLKSAIKDRQLPELPGSQRLPEHIWVKIFSYLDVGNKVRLESVSKLWGCLSKRSWTDVRCVPRADMPHTLMPEYFEEILKRSGQFCLKINLSCVDVAQVALTGRGKFRIRNKLRWLFRVIVTNCPRLQQLTIPNAAIIDEDLEFLFTNLTYLDSLLLHKVIQTPEGPLKGLAFSQCPPLKTLSLNISQICRCVEDEAILHVAERCQHSLTVFELHKHMGNYISDSAFERLFTNCTQLQKISLQYFGDHLETDMGGSAVHIGSLKHLTHLCLWLPVIKEEVVGAIISCCKLLSTLELHTGNLSALGLATVVSSRNLIDLRLDVPQNIPWRQLIPEIAVNNPRLEVLALTSVSEFDLLLTLEVFASLKQFCLWSTTDITGATLENLFLSAQPRTKILTIVASCFELNISPTLKEFLRSNDTQLRLSCFIDHQNYNCDFY